MLYYVESAGPSRHQACQVTAVMPISLHPASPASFIKPSSQPASIKF